MTISGLVAGLGSLAIFLGPVTRLIDGIDVFQNTAALTAGAVVAFVLPFWVLSPNKNNSLFDEWLPKAGILDRKEQLEWLTVFGISTTFVSLFFVLVHPVAFCSVFVAYSVFYLAGVWYLHTQVKEGIDNQIFGKDSS